MVLGWRDRVAEANRSRRVPHRARRPQVPARTPRRSRATSPDPGCRPHGPNPDLARALLVDAFDAGAYAPPRVVGDPVLDADAADRRRGRCVSAFAALCRLREDGTATPGDASCPGAGSRLDPRLAPEERRAFAAVVAGVAAEADADVDVAADAALDAAGDVEGVRERHERAARRVAAALTALAKPAAWDMCLTAGCDPEATTRLVSSSPFFRMARERRGCDQTPVDDPAAKIYDVGRVEAARDVSNDAEEEEEEEDDDDDAEVFDEDEPEDAPTSSPPTSSSPSSSSPSSSSRRVVDSDAFDPVFTAGCLALDAWASTADASGRVIAPFSSVEIAYQLVARCLDALTFEHGASRASDRRLSVLEYSDADDDAGGVTERRRTKRRRDGVHPRARWEAFTRAARAIRAARALSRTYDADPEANARALIPPIELAILANALMRFAPPRARVPRFRDDFGEDFGEEDFGDDFRDDFATLDHATLDHATIGETFVDAMALLRAVTVTSTGSYRDAYVANRHAWSASRTPDGRAIEPYAWIFQSGFARRTHVKLRRRAGHYLYSLASREGGWRLSQDTHADALEASADAAFAGMPMDDAHATRAMRRARRLVAARLVAVGRLTRADARAFDVRPATLAMDAVADPKAFRTRFTGEVMRFLRAWALAGGTPRASDVNLAAFDAAYDFKRLAETAHRPSAREHRGDVHRPPALDAQAKHLGHVVETIGWMFEMAGNDDKGVDDKGVDENGTSPRFSSRATSPRFSSRATSPRFSSHAAERGARAFAEMAASAAARVASHATPEVFARLSLGLGRIARSAETSLGGEGWAPGWDPSDVSTFARAATRALESSATEPQHARDARDGVEALASAGGFDIPRETWDALDASDARWRRRETAFIAAQYTFGQGLAAARGVPLRPDAVADRDAATAKAAKHLSGKSLAAVAKAWARRARFHGATPDEDAVAALVDALPNAEPPATFAELELIERALLDLRTLDEPSTNAEPSRWHYEARRDEWFAALPVGKRAKLRAELEAAETTSSKAATKALVANVRADAAKTRDATRRGILDALARLEP